MKCVNCQNDAKYSERTNRACPKCGQAFAFEPKDGDKLTDGAFKSAIERVSSGHRVKWSKDHLYYEIARKLRRTRAAMFVLIGIGAALALFAIAEPALLLGTFVLWSIAAAAAPGKTLSLPRAEFDGMWEKWVRAHGAPKSLIVRSAASAKRRSALPSDIAHYSFDRAVITDRSETVDVLLANNFHFENNCAVLSLGGYPEAAFDTVRAMLKKNPKLVVYALHDATPSGCALPHKLASSPNWFKNNGRVVDVGLRPEHAPAFKGLWRAPSTSVALTVPLSAKDATWLASYSLELAAIRPEQLIKRLFRAMSAASDVDGSSGDAGYYVDSSSFSADASASDGGGDSFG